VWLFFALLVRFGISRRNAAFGALMLGLSPLFVPLAASYMTDVSGLLGLSNNAKLKQPVVWPWGMGLVLLHAFAILYRFGSLPIAPVYGDEIIINDPAIALSRGQGLIAPSFTDSPFGIDKLFAHFPPVYLYLQSIIFRWLGVSVYSMRLLTTVMSIAAVAVFVLLVHLLCKWGVAKPRTALLLAALYALSSPTIVLHRVARMESLIEFLALSSLACVLAAYFMPLQNETGGRGSKARIVHVGLLIARCFLAGLCLATHPEAITAILPIALLVLLTPSLQIGTRIAITTTIALISHPHLGHRLWLTLGCRTPRNDHHWGGEYACPEHLQVRRRPVEPRPASWCGDVDTVLSVPDRVARSSSPCPRVLPAQIRGEEVGWPPAGASNREHGNGDIGSAHPRTVVVVYSSVNHTLRSHVPDLPCGHRGLAA